MKTIIVYLAFFAILFPLYLIAQPSWERVTPLPQEATLNDIIKIPGTNKLIASGGGSTVMISGNAGETWQINYHPAGMDNDYIGKCIYFLNSSVGFIGGSYYSILKTTDGGINWYLVDSSNTIYSSDQIKDIEFINETTGFAVGEYTSIKKTIDGGETWTSVEAGNDFNLKQIAFCNETTGFIIGSSNENLLKTIDGGISWQIINYPTGIEDLNLNKMQFANETIGYAYCSAGYPNYDGAICKTTDSGNTWFTVYDDPSAYGGSMDFIDTQHGVIGAGDGMYSSKILLTENGGTNWTDIELPGFSWFGTYSVCFLDQENVFCVGSMGMVFKSANGGENWEAIHLRTFYGEIYQLQFLNENIGFALSTDHTGGLASSDLKKTIDGGHNWELIAGISDYNGTFYFIDQELGFLATKDFGLKVGKSTDGGENWIVTETEFDFEPEDIKFYETNTGLIVGEYQIIKTTDSGYTWEEVFYSPSFWPHFYDIEFITEEDIFIVGVDENYASTAIYKSNDGGNSWEIDSLGNYWAARDLFFLDEDIAFIVCENNAILKSIDGCDTWSETTIISQNPISFRSIYFPSDEVGYAVGDGTFETIVKTIDGGETWNSISSGSTSGLNGVYFSDEENGLIAGDGGVILKTTNGGITGFTESNLVSKISLFEIYPNPCTNQINIATEKSASWSEITISIFNQSGKLIIKMNHSISKFLSLPTNELVPGIYYCQIKTDKGIFETKKLIKL